MKITKTVRDREVTLKLDGWLDTLSAPELGREIAAVTDASAIILDFDGVEYIASSGLREVVSCHRHAKEMGASFALINVGTDAMSIFTLTGIDKKLDIRAK